MKTIKLLTIILSLLVSCFMGNLVAGFVDQTVVVGATNILPFVISAGFFGLSFLPVSPAGSLMAYALVNVDKPTSTMPGAGGNKKDKITIFRWDDVDVDTMPARDDNGIKITGDIPMKDSKNMVTIYATPSSISVGQKSEGDEDAKGFMQELKFDHPGAELEVEEFIQNNINQNLGAIVEYCSTGKKRLLGAPCAPLQMETDSVDDKDKNKSSITLKSSQKGSRIAEYEGAIDLGSGSGV